MTSTTSDDPVEALSDAHDRLERLSEDAPDETTLETVADAYRSVTTVFERWEERATDWDDFEGYVKFRNDLAETLESVPDDIPVREAFEEANSAVKTESVSSSLSNRDFETAREALEPAREHAERYDELREARKAYRSAYRQVRDRRNELEERVSDLRRLLRLGEADLDAPTERLREPIETYNETVEDAFESFRREASAREVLAFVDTACSYPLVDFEAPPDDLLAYVRDRPAGDQTIGELLEYAEYSRSKLGHYVDDPDLLKRRVATNRTYLERLSADPLRVEWPPPPAEELRFLGRELVSVVGRFADEEAVASARGVWRLSDRPDYDRLREAAVARAQLTDEERARIEDGTVGAELEAAEADLERVEEALEEYPKPGAL